MFGDSGVAALLSVQAALQQRHYDPFPQPEPVRVIAKIMNNLPVALRVQIADGISSSIGQPASEFREIDPDILAKWVIDGYPAEKYPGVVIGAPGLAATFLCTLMGYPFLPQSMLHNARRDIQPDDAQGYLDAGREITEPVLEKHPSLEATIHFDPVHDRFLIRRLVFVRMKMRNLPTAYRKFIADRLLPGSPVILVDCRYKWLRAEISDRLYFQLGGLGGISPQEYIEESEQLRSYRREWGATSDASWKIDHEYIEGPESEWGSVGPFLDEAEIAATESGQHPIRITHDHPSLLSERVFRLYSRSWQGHDRPTDVYVSVFTHSEPRFPLVTGCLPLWLPFITDENVRFAGKVLDEWRKLFPVEKPTGTVYVTLHPSFCSPPDIVDLSKWRELFSGYFEEIKFLGIDPGRYPFDLGSYVAMYPAILHEASQAKYPGTPFKRLPLDELEEILTT